MTAERTPWSPLLALAVRLGVTPAVFWRLSVREWRALAAPVQDGWLTRSAFDALASQFPDNAQ